MHHHACPCCADDDDPHHVLLHVPDVDSGDVLRIRVDRDHAHHPLGWGAARRVRWRDGEAEREGVEIGHDDAGLHVRDGDGVEHRVPHGGYLYREIAAPRPLTKATRRFLAGVRMLAKAALGPGERWITAHPWGDHERGVPLLLRENRDGTHSVIGGAGGKLNHLRLRNVEKPTEENRKKWADKAKERRQKRTDEDAERKAGQSEEEKEEETKTRAELRDAKQQAERQFVEDVRAKLGGVSDDLDEEALGQVESEGARNVLRAEHHRRQVREAREALAARTQELLEERDDGARSNAMIEAALDADPEIADEARSMAEADLRLEETDREERRREATLKRDRTAARAEDVSAPSDALLDHVDGADETEATLQALGGRNRPEEIVTASGEVRRQAAVAMADARALRRAVRGEDLSDADKKVVGDAMERLGLDADADPVEHADALNREVGRLARRSELRTARAARMAAMEAEGQGGKAKSALAASELMTGIASSVKAAKEMGLVDAAKTELRACEVSELRDLLEHKGRLREAQRAYADMVQQAHTMDYRAARQAFDLRVEAAPMDVDQDIREQEQTHLARLLHGVADPGRPEHVQAVASGHHEALADLSLGIARERVIDRTTLDAVGVRNAAILTRHALTDRGHDEETVLDALESHHVASQADVAREALAAAEVAVPGLTETVTDVGSIEDAMTRLDAYEADIADAQRTVGAALGQLEATAALGQAYREALPKHIELSAKTLGDLETQLQWLHAAGMTAEHYSVDAENRTIQIPQSSWHVLQRRDPEHIVQARAEVAAIKRGEQDEDGWLPPGIARRARSTFTDPVPERPRYFAPLDTSRGREGIAEHIGARLAEGEPPHEIGSDLLSPAVLNSVQDVDAYIEHVKALIPVLNENGDAAKSSAFAEHFQKLAQDYIDKNHPGGEAVGAVHSQTLRPDDPATREAVFRSLVTMPRARAAFTPVGALAPADRRALQDHFYERQGIADARNYQEHYDRAISEVGAEPEKYGGTASMFGGGMFGGGAPQEPSAEWKEWRDRAEEITRMYPREGRDLAVRLLGDRPEDKRHADLTDEIASHVDAIHRESPWLSADKVVQQVRRRRGADEARKQGADPDLQDALGRYASEQYAPRINPQHVHDYLAPRLWDHQHELVKRRASTASTPWAQYVEMHKGLEGAYHALQDEIRGDFAQHFADHYGRVAGRPLQRTRVEVRGWERHRLAVGTMEEQEEWRKERAKSLSSLRTREGGRYAEEGEAGAVLERERKAMEADAIATQQQGGMFGGRQAGMFGGGGDEGGGMFGAPPAPKVQQRHEEELDRLRPGERRSLGERVEAELGSLVGTMGAQVDPQSGGTDLIPDLNMDGSRVHQQRVLRALDAAGGRLGALLGTGSGKSLTSIGAFTQAHARGEAQHGLYLVPTAVQEQFGGEMLRYTEPGRYSWKTGNKMRHADRVELLRNPDVHMRVLTHEAFRDTVVRLMADHHGMTAARMTEHLLSVSHRERAELWQAAREANKIPAHFVYEDEAHKSFQRAGQPPSALSAVMDAVSHPLNATHYLAGTATALKNDESELHSMARRLDPDRYADRHDYMTAFGENLDQNTNALRRELEHQTYTAHIRPEGVERIDTHNPRIVGGKKVAGHGSLPLEPAHAAHVQHVENAYERAKLARDRGGVDVDAIRELSPSGWEHVPEEEHEALARQKQEALAGLREHALRRAINQAPPEINTKLKRLADIVEHDLKRGEWEDRKGETHQGKASVVFSDSAREVHMITEHLRSRGIRAVAYHGGLSVADRKRVQDGYQPEGGGEPEHDVIVGTSAMEAGVNLQRAKVIHHYDVPQTFKSHAQRSGRAYRQGQQGDVEVHDWHTDHDYEARALRRLKRKEGLHDVMGSNVPLLDETGIAGAYHTALAERRERDEVPMEIAAK